MNGRSLTVFAALVWQANIAHADGTNTGPKTTVGIAVTYWFASGKFDNWAHSSPGLRPRSEYRLAQWASVTATFDYMFLDEKNDPAKTFFALSAGPRFNIPRLGPVEPYAEILVGWQLFDHGRTAHAAGLRVCSGLSYALPDDFLVSVGIGYSAASFGLGGSDGITESWSIVVVEAGIATRW